MNSERSGPSALDGLANLLFGSLPDAALRNPGDVLNEYVKKVEVSTCLMTSPMHWKVLVVFMNSFFCLGTTPADRA